jgi:hypothetical protein
MLFIFRHLLFRKGTECVYKKKIQKSVLRILHLHLFNEKKTTPLNPRGVYPTNTQNEKSTLTQSKSVGSVNTASEGVNIIWQLV